MIGETVSGETMMTITTRQGEAGAEVHHAEGDSEMIVHQGEVAEMIEGGAHQGAGGDMMTIDVEAGDTTTAEVEIVTMTAEVGTGTMIVAEVVDTTIAMMTVAVEADMTMTVEVGADTMMTGVMDGEQEFNN